MPASAETFSRPQQEHAPQQSHSLKEGLDRAIGYFRSEEYPMTKKIPDIHRALETHDTVIVEGQTGTGKSTVTPLIVLESVLEKNQDAKVAMTQPRRGTAKGIANTLSNHVGKEYVGYRYKGESTVGNKTRLEVLMERSLLNEILLDKQLKKFDAVILDEVHERSANIDIILPLLKEIQQERRQMGKPLKIVLTSATLNIEKFQNYFGESAVVKAEGEIHPITVNFAKYQIDRKNSPQDVGKQIDEIVGSGETGDILAVQEGRNPISKAMTATTSNVDKVVLVGGEDGSLEGIEKKTDKQTAFYGTNAVETGLTIKSIDHVVDTGLMKVNRYNPTTRTNRLTTEKVTQGNARQRWGRVGRVRPGTVHARYTEDDFNSRPKDIEPELMRSDLMMQVLMLKSLNKHDIHNVDFFDHPGEEKINHAFERLRFLGALDEKGSVTEVGLKMLAMEAEPVYSRMLIEAEKRGCLQDVAILVGVLNADSSLYDFDFKKTESFAEKYKDFYVKGNDFKTVINMWNNYLENKDDRQWGKNHGVKTSVFDNAVNTGSRMIGKRPNDLNSHRIDISEENLDNIMESLMSGLIEYVVERTDNGYQTSLGKASVQINKNSAIQGQQLDYFISGKLRFSEDNGVTYAEYNMEVPQEIKEAAKEEQAVNATENEHKEETSKETQEEETHHDEQNHSSPHPVQSPSSEQHTTDHETTHHESEKQKNIFQQIGEKIKQFGEKVGNAIRTVLKKLKIIR